MSGAPRLCARALPTPRPACCRTGALPTELARGAGEAHLGARGASLPPCALKLRGRGLRPLGGTQRAAGVCCGVQTVRGRQARRARVMAGWVPRCTFKQRPCARSHRLPPPIHSHRTPLLCWHRGSAGEEAHPLAERSSARAHGGRAGPCRCHRRHRIAQGRVVVGGRGRLGPQGGTCPRGLACWRTPRRAPRPNCSPDGRPTATQSSPARRGTRLPLRP